MFEGRINECMRKDCHSTHVAAREGRVCSGAQGWVCVWCVCVCVCVCVWRVTQAEPVCLQGFQRELL